MKSRKIQVNDLSESAKTSMKTRTISSIVGLAILIPCVIVGDWAMLIFLLICLGVAVFEIIRCAGKKISLWTYGIMFVYCVSLMLWPFIRNLIMYALDNKTAQIGWHVYNAFDSVVVSLLLLVVAVFGLFFVIMYDETFSVRDACFIFTMCFLTSLGFQSFMYIRNIPMVGKVTEGGFYNYGNTIGSMALFCYLLISVLATDTGAYFIGMLFGKKKVNTRISPNKTWAGFFGGMIISTALSFTFGLVLAICKRPMLVIFDLDHWYNILILSILIPPFATLGDFVFSAIKRYFNIKDFGNIMPGHGGVLDRADSEVFAALVIALYVSIGLWAHNGFQGPLFI